MNTISINHAQHANASNRLARTLLIAGLCAFIGTFIFLRQMTTESESIKAQLETLVLPKTASAISSKRLPDAKAPAELEVINEVVSEILLPWPALFNALEKANQDDVKLLAVEPKMQDRSMRITAMTFDVEHMQAYIKGLSTQDTLKQVNLISTESVEVAGITAMQFELNVGW